jgi:predicted CoA-substrate-specific enzyme activase
MEYYLGIDVGSVSTNIVCIDSKDKVIETLYIKTHGNPIASVKTGLKQMQSKLQKKAKIYGVGVTGSARHLIAAMVGADLIKNEITAHARATLHFYPHAKTIIEIGGQDSKIIILRDGIVVDFSMNNVCAAGTGSFLDQQASRLGIPIDEFGAMALESKTDVSIAGRCTVFAESDMIHKQQLGYSLNDIINGLCHALVRNYFNTVGKGKDIISPIIFQGGVAANIGIRKAFEKYLEKPLIIPEHFGVMGAVGAAIISKEEMKKTKAQTKFKGLKISDLNFKTTSFRCKLCPNHCEIVQFFEDKKVIARFGDKCGRYNE